MKANLNNFNSYKIYNNQTSFKQRSVDSSSFKPSFDKKKSTNKRFMQAFRNYALAGALLLGVTKCVSNDTYSAVQDVDGIKIEYFDVKKETMDSALTPLFQLKTQLNDKNDFLDGVQVDIAKKYTSFDDANSFRKHLKESSSSRRVKGSSFYSDSKLPKRIAIQEASHNGDKLLSFVKNGDYSNIGTLRQTVMHEVGHLFDQFFGHNHNAKFAKKWDEIQEYLEVNSATPYKNPQNIEHRKAQILYNWNNSLSDKKVFQDAMLKDLKHIAVLKKTNSDALASNLDYYTASVNFDKEITPEIVDLVNEERAEVYANLFSFAVGQDDGDKTRFTENFKNCYEVVKDDIQKYLNIELND